MSKYDIKIKKLLKKGSGGNTKTEIWAEIIDKDTSKIINQKIWWEDDEGVYHDGTPDLPPELRKVIDNAWIEKIRK